MREPTLDELVKAIRNIRRTGGDPFVGNIMEELGLGLGRTKSDYVFFHILLAEGIRQDRITYAGVGEYYLSHLEPDYESTDRMEEEEQEDYHAYQEESSKAFSVLETDPEFLECEPHGQLTD